MLRCGSFTWVGGPVCASLFTLSVCLDVCVVLLSVYNLLLLRSLRVRTKSEAVINQRLILLWILVRLLITRPLFANTEPEPVVESHDLRLRVGRASLVLQFSLGVATIVSFCVFWSKFVDMLTHGSHSRAIRKPLLVCLRTTLVPASFVVFLVLCAEPSLQFVVTFTYGTLLTVVSVVALVRVFVLASLPLRSDMHHPHSSRALNGSNLSLHSSIGNGFNASKLQGPYANTYQEPKSQSVCERVSVFANASLQWLTTATCISSCDNVDGSDSENELERYNALDGCIEGEQLIQARRLSLQLRGLTVLLLFAILVHECTMWARHHFADKSHPTQLITGYFVEITTGLVALLVSRVYSHPSLHMWSRPTESPISIVSGF